MRLRSRVAARHRDARPWLTRTLLALVALGCGGGEITGPKVVPVASVLVSPDTATLVVGASRQLSVTARDVEGTPLAGRTVAWSSSDEAVATVSAGLVTAAGAGSAWIIATSEGKSDSASITAYVPVATVAVSSAPDTLLIGTSAQLVATTLAADGDTLTGRTVRWNSSSAAVVTVDSTGLVTAVAGGSATITATSESKSGQVTVVVPPHAITLSTATDSISIAQGGTATIEAIVTRHGGYTGEVVVAAATALPAGVTLAADTLAAGDSVATLQLVVGGDATVATTTFDLAASGSGVEPQAATVALTITAGGTVLTSGIPLTDLSGAADAQALYRIVVPPGTAQLLVETGGGTGDVDLYVRGATPPTTSSYACRSWTTGNTERCAISNPAAGDWYVMLNAYEAYAGVSLVASTTAVTGDFSIATTSTSLTIARSRSGVFAITATRVDGFTGPITVSAEGLPAGVTAPAITIAEGSTTGQLTVSASSSADTGTTTITLRAQANGLADRTLTASLTVEAVATGGFHFTRSPETIDLLQDGSQRMILTLTRTGSFNEAVSVNVSNIPNGVILVDGPYFSVGKTVDTVVFNASRTVEPLATEIIFSAFVYGWGEQRDTIPLTVTIPPAVEFQTITGGRFSTCGTDASGNAFCWGSNYGGKVGDSTTTDRQRPTAAVGGHHFTQVSSGYHHACGVKDDGSAWCWGRGTGGALGVGDTMPRNAPTPVEGGLTFARISAGANLTCGVTTAGEGYCWGANRYGSVGVGDTLTRLTPTAVAGGLTFADIGAGVTHACGLTATGSAYCWGDDFYGEIGDGSLDDPARLTPVPVNGGLTFTSIAVGPTHNCALDAQGNAYCWGSNLDGELGVNQAPTMWGTPEPVAVHGGLTFSVITAGDFHTCGLTTAGAAYCWGDNNYDAVGDGTGQDRLVPTAVAGGHAYVAIDAGESHNCAIATTAETYCWGSNNAGNLGNGIAGTDAPEPVLVLPPRSLPATTTSAALRRR